MENATKITCPSCGANMLFASRNGDYIFRNRGDKLQTQAKCSACGLMFEYDLILVDNPKEVTGNEKWKD